MGAIIPNLMGLSALLALTGSITKAKQTTVNKKNTFFIF
jgi:hypothetical protein